MLIDWFTVGAQALNFAVLVWLMRRFLYKPVQGAIAAREGRIAAELADADTKKAEAARDRDAFEHKSAAFDDERAALMTQATEAATGERDRLLDAARKAADDLAAKRAQALAADADTLSRSLRERTQHEVFAIARKALGDLASTSLERSLCDAFVGRLRALDDAHKQRAAAAFRSASGPLLVRSAFELTAAQRAALLAAIDETFATKATLRFETSADLVAGIELSANGQKLAWSMADYLAALERGVAALLQPVPVPEAVAKPVAPPIEEPVPS